jgi:hypothetical protein
MRKLLTTILTVAAMTSVLNAGDKFDDLTPEYLNNTASVEVKRIIANDPQTAHKTLAILFNDKDLRVRGNVVANPNF